VALYELDDYNINGGSYSSESAWNNGNGYAGGGGVSTFWTMPSWQKGPGVIDATFSSTSACAANTGNTGLFCREVPDVSLNADPNKGYPVFCTTGSFCTSPPYGWKSVGGTSAAAPMWAAMMALANEKSLHDGNFNLGFLNPLLYQIDQNASSTSYANDFQETLTQPTSWE
jgi:subtilase family serine protease